MYVCMIPCNKHFKVLNIIVFISQASRQQKSAACSNVSKNKCKKHQDEEPSQATCSLSNICDTNCSENLQFENNVAHSVNKIPVYQPEVKISKTKRKRRSSASSHSNTAIYSDASKSSSPEKGRSCSFILVLLLIKLIVMVILCYIFNCNN